MTQILGIDVIKRWLAPSRPVRVPSVEDEGIEGVRTSRMILKPMTREDMPGLTQVVRCDSGHLFQWLPRPRGCMSNADIAASLICRGIEGDQSGKAWRRLAVGPGGTIIGGINVIHIERGLNWQADVNWWVTSEYNNQGYGTEMVAAALKHAFADLPRGLGLHRVHAGIQPENAASIRLAEKVGFLPDPALNSRLLVNGIWQIHHGYVARI